MSKMIKCKVCGEMVAKDAHSCPHCGARLKRGGGCLSVVFKCLIAPAILFIIYWSYVNYTYKKTVKETMSAYVQAVDEASDAYAEAVGEVSNAYSEAVSGYSKAYTEAAAEASNAYTDAAAEVASAYAEAATELSNTYSETLNEAFGSYSQSTEETADSVLSEEGPSDQAGNTAPVKTSSEAGQEEPGSEPNQANGYQEIYEKYAQQIRDATPVLIEEYKQEAAENTQGIVGLATISTAKVTKLAAIQTSGTAEMATYMYSHGGSYSDYDEWASKLYEVYEEEAEKITNLYMNQ